MRTIKSLKFLSSIERQWLIISSAIVILTISIFFIGQSFSVSRAGYQQYYDRMLELKELEADFDRVILTSRYELFSSYDPLVKNLAKQRSLEQELKKIPRFVNFNNRKTIEKSLAEKFESLKEKEELSERFKSRNALLKNSLRYLPLLTSQVNSQDSKGLTPEIFSSLKATLEGLIRNLLLYNISVDRELTTNIKTLTTQLLDIDIKNKVKKEDFPTEKVISHANIILNTKPQVENLTTQLLSPSEPSTEDLKKIFQTSYSQALQRVKIYRILSFIWFLVILALSNYLWLKRSRNRQEPSFARIKQQIEQISAELSPLIEKSHRSSHINSVSENCLFSRLETHKKELDKLAHQVQRTSEYWQTKESQIQQQIQDLQSQLETAKQHIEKTVTKAKETKLNQQILQLSATLEHVRSQKQTIEPESELTEGSIAHLSLLTKQRRQLMTPPMWERLETVFGNALNERKCQQLDFQSSPELIQLSFCHPPQIQLSRLVLHLKSVASTCLYEEFQDQLQDIKEPGDIWSETYFLTISDASANREEVQAQ
ncbi:transposase [Oscillatoriales cyanobacterium LEGE 11467]|uniref:Transposase n=1 Tax=Zarconia navalis LEGE 11467 TaxID=1828826 RepID=A0A928VXK4_9CYAN|nr:DAHL domain-containing protein [Zarconia navalis]MBE9041133.1 transposase [Zarconia navalis LEGE 11467]